MSTKSQRKIIDHWIYEQIYALVSLVQVSKELNLYVLHKTNWISYKIKSIMKVGDKKKTFQMEIQCGRFQ